MESLVKIFSFHTFCSVKIWMSNKEDLEKSAELYTSSFSLLKEVMFSLSLSVISTFVLFAAEEQVGYGLL